MAGDEELKIKDAAVAQVDETREANEQADTRIESSSEAAAAGHAAQPSVLDEGDGFEAFEDVDVADLEEGELQSRLDDIDDMTMDQRKETFKWVKCPITEPEKYEGQEIYYHNIGTGQSQFEEPDDPYWEYDSATGAPNYDDGLRFPMVTMFTYDDARRTVAGAWAIYKQRARIPDNFAGTPKLKLEFHAMWKKFRPEEEKEEEEKKKAEQAAVEDHQAAMDAYGASANFNRFTGKFARENRDVSEHGRQERQLDAFYNVHDAANAHDGRSLKEERRNKQFSRKEIQEMNAKRHEKKTKKRLAFLTS